MVEARALATPYQVRFCAGQNTGSADTVKDGVGGSSGLRPHELLEAALASCMTISARTALAELGLTGTDVNITVTLARQEDLTRFRYRLVLDPPVSEPQYRAVAERVRQSPVRRTLSKPLEFEPSDR
ncbi:OsmC family protein [Actinomadura rubrisoli]|uniref:OsmC family peroxiredoxin n=1 Tax=Actinomadura rubrisoli TaxID=2530368 RepID=A0A4R5B355_9ACTN|nr:OsmC family protein [Actinomadura rubrisoli]TDD80171.1 OsmC family peroxiredoxin [Actinomadura rubrisoli]